MQFLSFQDLPEAVLKQLFLAGSVPVTPFHKKIATKTSAKTPNYLLFCGAHPELFPSALSEFPSLAKCINLTL